MVVSAPEWVVALGGTTAVLLFDVAVMARRAREPATRDCAIALSVYTGLAVLFGSWVWVWHGRRFGLEFFAGWLTEYSLSVDNLFIFIVIMATFNVPKVYQKQVLFVGIVTALVLRGIFIALGAAAIQRFSWIFYVFGVFLVLTALRLARGAGREAGAHNAVVRFARTRFRTTDSWHGLGLFRYEGSRRVVTPMSVVVLSLGAADLMFALDSIPAIYGLTREAYLVFAANVFALMGLRQLYFLLGGLLDRLVFLSTGLAVVFFFIGTKLVLHALRENQLPFVNGGEPVNVPEISTLFSLAVIAATLGITAIASLFATRVRDSG